MIDVYSHRGFPFSDEKDRLTRQYYVDFLKLTVEQSLTQVDKRWTFEYIDSPLMIPKEYLKLGYKEDYIYGVKDYRLRPETTEATYAYAQMVGINPPHCIWQHSRSARPEPVNKTNMHLHEFWQLEFQCFYVPSDINYMNTVLEPLRDAVTYLTRLDARIVQSETSPSYSPLIMDIEVLYGGLWLEVASILLRNDSGIDGVLNLEIAFGTDRLVRSTNFY